MLLLNAGPDARDCGVADSWCAFRSLDPMTDTRGAAPSTVVNGSGADDKDPSLTTLKRPRVWWHRHLDSEERQRVMSELAIKRQEHWGFRFATMTTLSVIVAVMGLSADSAAVVIGAMLLAPLMTPVLATAACISMALFRKALRSFGVVALATVGSIVLSYVLAAIFMNGELPSEVTSRVAPDIRDLVVALGAGTAGAYATVRKDASSSLPGVAVAVALIPPLATVGITLEAGNPTFARGAMLLYTTNLAAIILAGAIVFVFTGFVPPRRLATTGLRSLAVATVVLVVVVAIAVPLFRASTSAVEQSDREIEAQQIVGNWLGIVEPTRSPDITFEGDRILVSIRSFDAPIDQTPLVDAMQAEFGAGRIVSTEWDQVQRAVTTTTAAPTTTIVSDEERLQTAVETIVDDWLAEDAPPSGRGRDALTIADGVVRVDASGVGDAPSVASLIERLDTDLEQTFEVQLTWLKREDVPNGQPEPTTDEVLLGRVGVVVNEWARANDVVVQGLTVTDGQVVVNLTGPEQPDATELVDSIDELLGTTGDVQVLFTQRLDITTTTTTISPFANTPI
jgi:uncharacterized hydrophobic protein (TIGR00271 family)